MVVEPNYSIGGFNIIDFLQQNILIVVAVIVIAALFFMFIKVKKKQPKIISRADIERGRRIKELSKNNRIISSEIRIGGQQKIIDREYKFLVHGSNYLGNITNIGKRLREDKEQNREYYEIVFKPLLFQFRGFGIAQPGKKEILLIDSNEVILLDASKTIHILPNVSLDGHLGCFYDVPHEQEHLNWINENLFRHDKEDISSFYFVESQKKSTIDLENARRMAELQRELDIELARKRGKQTSL